MVPYGLAACYHILSAVWPCASSLGTPQSCMLLCEALLCVCNELLCRDGSGKNGRRYIAIQNVAKIISVVETLYAILTVCLG